MNPENDAEMISSYLFFYWTTVYFSRSVYLLRTQGSFWRLYGGIYGVLGLNPSWPQRANVLPPALYLWFKENAMYFGRLGVIGTLEQMDVCLTWSTQSWFPVSAIPALVSLSIVPEVTTEHHQVCNLDPSKKGKLNQLHFRIIDFYNRKQYFWLWRWGSLLDILKESR